MTADSNKYIELSELQTLIRRRIGHLESWVRVEIESHREVGGHHYLNVLEKGAGGLVAAKASARIWRSNAWIIEDFRRLTGKGLEPGMSVVVKAVVDYHPQYGLSLVISEIDASFSIGRRELEKQETIRRLTASGLMDKQKSLLLPYLPSSVAVISSRDAAGYGDFVKHLNDNVEGYHFNCTLFQSLMQGDSAPASIMRSLRNVEGFDLVLILRGGGADSDLFCFDDYELCKAIAECPVPVMTAIGHERDFHVADMVAIAYFKTPTALADALVEMVSDVESSMTDALDGVVDALEERLSFEESVTDMLFSNIRYHLSQRVGEMSSDVDRLFASITGALALKSRNMSASIDALLALIISDAGRMIQYCENDTSLALSNIYHCSSRRIEASEESMRQALSGIGNGVLSRIGASETEVERSLSTIRFALATTLNMWDARVALSEAAIRTFDPRGLLRQGYVLAIGRDGNILKSASSAAVGEDFSLKFSDGLWDCSINGVKTDAKSQ